MEKKICRRGGKRDGAGRPCKSAGLHTKVMRVPDLMSKNVKTLIKVQIEQLYNPNHTCYYSEQEEQQRRELISSLESIIRYEKERLSNVYKIMKAEENSSKQLLTLF